MKLLLLGFVFSVQAFAVPAVNFNPIKSIPFLVNEDHCAYYENDIYDDPSEIDHFHGECMGFGGWKLDVYGMDARSYLKLSRGKQVVNLEDQISGVGQFPNFMSDVEWRIKMVLNESAKPFAFLFEISGQRADDVNKYNGSVLIVKLGAAKSCLMGRVDFDGDDKAKRKAAWQKARHEADLKAPTFNCP